MQPVTPFFREAGSGPGVVCLHANASSSGQWRALMEALAPRFHVFAPDAYNVGKSPTWPLERPVRLRDEVDLLEPVFARAGDPFAVVAHSYGAATALIAALAHPGRIRVMALYEPVLFALVDAQTPPPNDADGIRDAIARSIAALAADDRAEASRCFIDFWMGQSAFDGMPEQRKAPIAASIVNIGRWADALFNEPTPLRAFSELDIPVLYMCGKDSQPSARGVTRLLTRTLPQVEVVEFEGLGHMGPVTHPEVVNRTICRFLGA